LEARVRQSAKAAAALLKRLERRAVATSSQPAVDALVQGFSQLEALVLTEHGLFATHRAALAANLNAQAQTLKDVLTISSQRVKQALLQAERQAQALNADAKAMTQRAAHQAQIGIALIIFTSLIMAILAGVWIMQAIAVPLREGGARLEPDCRWGSDGRHSGHSGR
jgi:hypothetical protein